jgi:hypothetical protein
MDLLDRAHRRVPSVTNQLEPVEPVVPLDPVDDVAGAFEHTSETRCPDAHVVRARHFLTKVVRSSSMAAFSPVLASVDLIAVRAALSGSRLAGVAEVTLKT